MTANVELLRLENTQLNLGAWVDNLRLGVMSPADVINELTHTYAEFAENQKLVEYTPYVQEGNSLYLVQNNQKLSVAEFIQRGIANPWAQLQVNEGLNPLFEKIAAAKKPSFGLLFSPPGPTEFGYDKHAFLYLFQIPKLDSDNTRTIRSFALRIEGFGTQAAQKSIQFLSGLGLIQNMKARDDETLLTNSTVFEKGSQVSLLPDKKGKFLQIPVQSIEDLLFAIGQYLPDKFSAQEIKAGISGKALGKVYQKFKPQIYNILTRLWAAAKGYDSKFNAQAEKQVLDTMLEDMYLARGSCPSVQHNNNSLTEDQDNSQETKFCQHCMKFYSGFRCPYC
ncbi:hypothetical protein ACFLZ1_02375 [Patescibacteria group bacterium]